MSIDINPVEFVTEFKKFYLAYLEAIEFTEKETVLEGSDTDAFEFSSEALTKALITAAMFFSDNYELISQACDEPGYRMETAGHDFWLTSNGHGVGYWDRGLGDVGAKLTEMCKAEHPPEVYLGDDGKVQL